MDHDFGLLLLLFTTKTLQLVAKGFLFFHFPSFSVLLQIRVLDAKFFAALESQHDNEKHIAVWEGPLKVDAVIFLYFYGTCAT